LLAGFVSRLSFLVSRLRSLFKQFRVEHTLFQRQVHFFKAVIDAFHTQLRFIAPAPPGNRSYAADHSKNSDDQGDSLGQKKAVLG